MSQDSPENTKNNNSQEDNVSWLSLLVRSMVGGVLMGLANLVPGISGGTMLLATGIYPRFIKAIADVTGLPARLLGKKKASTREMNAGQPVILGVPIVSWLTLGVVCISAVGAIGGLAGPVRDLVVVYRWVMFSLFIGLTLGGVPLVWKMLDKFDVRAVFGLIVGFLIMSGLAIVQALGLGEQGGSSSNFMMLLIAGVAGAGAMILPGVSGGYLLLVLGQYVPILDAIARFTSALKDRDLTEIASIGMFEVAPVGIGVILGIVVVSQGLKWMLTRYERFTLGVLLGLLLGAVVGLWPYTQTLNLSEISSVRGQPVELINNDFSDEIKQDKRIADLKKVLVFTGKDEPVKRHYYPSKMVMPTVKQAVIGLLLILLGFAITFVLALFGGKKKSEKPGTGVVKTADESV